MLKSIAFGATTSVGGYLAAPRNDSRQQAPTTYLSDTEAQQFSRTERENVYELSYTWSHRNRRWQVGFSLSKERYHSVTRASRSISRGFSAAVSGGLPSDISAELSRPIDSAGIDSPIERLGFAATFVRSLEYQRDKTATGELEYPKYVEETLTENGGDCEDFAALLARIISASPFNHHIVLLFFAGHVGLGVDPSAFAESVGPLLTVDGREYLYVDANIDVSLGRIPSKYRDPGVIARFDGAWQITDPIGLKEHLMRSIPNGTVGGVGNYI